MPFPPIDDGKSEKAQGIGLNIGGLGGGIALGIGEQLMNQAFAGMNQKRQLKGLERAHQIQNKYALEMWEKTGYGAQKKQMEEAGINPALLYGMSGGGGQTSQSSSSDMPTATGQAANLTGPVMGMLNASLLQSQIEVNKSIANKNNTDAGYTGGVQTEGAKQGIESEKVRRAGMIWENQMKALQYQIEDDSQWYTRGNRLEQYMQNTAKTRQEMAKANVDEATIDTTIAQKNADVALTTTLARAKEKEIQLNDQQIDNLKALFLQIPRLAESQIWQTETGAKRQLTEQQRLDWEKIMKNVPDDMKLIVESAQDVIQALILKGAIKPSEPYNPPGYNPNRYK